jgi:hypothetical protein
MWYMINYQMRHAVPQLAASRHLHPESRQRKKKMLGNHNSLVMIIELVNKCIHSYNIIGYQY